MVTKEIFENAVQEWFKTEYSTATMIASTKYDEMWMDLRTRGKNKVAETEQVAETESKYHNGNLVLVRKT